MHCISFDVEFSFSDLNASLITFSTSLIYFASFFPYFFRGVCECVCQYSTLVLPTCAQLSGLAGVKFDPILYGLNAATNSIESHVQYKAPLGVKEI